MSNDDGLDFLDEVTRPTASQAKGRGRRREDAFNTGLETVSPSQAARATGSKSMAGQYKRFTLYLAPEDIVRFQEVAVAIGLSQAETGRWFFQHMFSLFDEGVRPETEPVVVRRRLKR